LDLGKVGRGVNVRSAMNIEAIRDSWRPVDNLFRPATHTQLQQIPHELVLNENPMPLLLMFQQRFVKGEEASPHQRRGVGRAEEG
jgi:hypothetical protein